MDELDRTKRITAEFGTPGGVGEKLQKLLERRAEEKDNWVSNLAIILLIVVIAIILIAFRLVGSGGLSWLQTASCRSFKPWHWLPIHANGKH